ncbi:MAG TPA: universal stress protein [Gemmatimonadaceae bacterium]|nr:universal stress protein [Gemmatimonadaceae bacterium]
MTAVELITEEMETRTVFSPKPTARSIVVATDSSQTALAAFAAAAMLRAKTGAQIHVLTVIEPMPIMFPAVEGMMMSPELEKSREEAQRALVADQIKAYDRGCTWSLDITVGRPADSIVGFAREQAADLIIIGSNKHGLVGRFVGEETASEIARLSDVPLLVASPDLKRAPKRILIAMGLNFEGLRAAPRTLELLCDKSPSISCVHVKPRSEFLGIDWAEFDSEYELAMKDRFAEVEKALAGVNMRGDLVVLHGEAEREIVDFASYSKAELIVVGVRRRRGRARAIGGRMAARVLRHASCSVMVLPDVPPRDKAMEVPAGATHVIQDPALWSKALREFTSRNAGRMVNLEVDDPEAGALVEATQYPFLGADYDRKDGRLTIALGYTRGLERHLSRSVTNPENVAILSINGRDTALSVSHGGEQTLLTF